MINALVKLLITHHRKISENRLLELLHKHSAPKQRGQQQTPSLQPSWRDATLQNKRDKVFLKVGEQPSRAKKDLQAA